jgi:TolA-binding protein
MPFGPSAGRPETEQNPMYGGAMAAYNKVITEYPTLDVAARSYVRIATIQFEHFGDLDAARTTLETLVKNYNGYAGIMTDARLLLGEVYLILGDLDRAAGQDAFVAGKPPYIGEQRERAAYRLAELDYFSGKFKDALAKLADLTRNPTADATNDALGLQIFIQENSKSGEDGLKEYAKAALLQRQRKLSEAIGRYESILKDYAGTDLIDETLLNIAAAYAQMGRFTESAAMYERLATDYPESIALDRALIQLGRVYAIGLKDVPKAIAAYQQLLEKYPNSIYVSAARKRVRELRGDSL